MHLQEVCVKNFRLLKDVSVALEVAPTVIVGRNNSGKTSLTELFRRLLSGSEPRFRFEDFSLATHDEFWNAYTLYTESRGDDEVRAALPYIEVKLTVRYGNSPIGALTPFVIDLDQNTFHAVILITYALKSGELARLFAPPGNDDKATDEERKAALYRLLRDRVPQCFASTIVAVDPTDSSTHHPVKWSDFHKLVRGCFINAQRGLDDVTDKDSFVLGRVLDALFKTASRATSDERDRDLAATLATAVEGIQAKVQTEFASQLANLLPTFNMFGYPGLSDPQLGAETTLDVQRLLTDNTRVFYTGRNGVNLPETYSGLGTRNLIYILLTLYQFYKAFLAEDTAPAMQLVFIEEPECHLHPQMQSVFIHRLSAIAAAFSQTTSPPCPWPVQFIVTTHSSHVANKAPFDTIRYFLAVADGSAPSSRRTKVKDLREGLSATPAPDRDFLHKYMTVTRCDLLFADKAILIEGEGERLLMPQMIEFVSGTSSNDQIQLSSQYISIIEVGGAHAHLFFDLVEFLELRTLIITDIDSTKKNSNNQGESCKVSEADATSNECIRRWFDKPDITPVDLLNLSEADKVQSSRRIAFQVPESSDKPCARTFEPAFMLANPDLFKLSKLPQNELESEVWTRSKKIEKKSDFAIQHGIRQSTWNVPRYIRDGLEWLAGKPEQDPSVTKIATIKPHNQGPRLDVPTATSQPGETLSSPKKSRVPKKGKGQA